MPDDIKKLISKSERLRAESKRLRAEITKLTGIRNQLGDFSKILIKETEHASGRTKVLSQIAYIASSIDDRLG
jgi:hypothetical protein